MDVFKSRLLGISVAVAHGVFSGSLNILLKFLISNYNFNFLTLIQFLTSSTAALTLETLRRLGKVDIPPFSMQLSKVKKKNLTPKLRSRGLLEGGLCNEWPKCNLQVGMTLIFLLSKTSLKILHIESPGTHMAHYP